MQWHLGNDKCCSGLQMGRQPAVRCAAGMLQAACAFVGLLLACSSHEHV